MPGPGTVSRLGTDVGVFSSTAKHREVALLWAETDTGISTTASWHRGSGISLGPDAASVISARVAGHGGVVATPALLPCIVPQVRGISQQRRLGASQWLQQQRTFLSLPSAASGLSAGSPGHGGAAEHLFHAALQHCISLPSESTAAHSGDNACCSWAVTEVSASTAELGALAWSKKVASCFRSLGSRGRAQRGCRVPI